MAGDPDGKSAGTGEGKEEVEGEGGVVGVVGEGGGGGSSGALRAQGGRVDERAEEVPQGEERNVRQLKGGSGDRRGGHERVLRDLVAQEEPELSVEERIERLETGVGLWGATYVPPIDPDRRMKLVDKWSGSRFANWDKPIEQVGKVSPAFAGVVFFCKRLVLVLSKTNCRVSGLRVTPCVGCCHRCRAIRIFISPGKL